MLVKSRWEGGLTSLGGGIPLWGEFTRTHAKGRELKGKIHFCKQMCVDYRRLGPK